MSLIVSLYVPEGLVLAGDSRLTLKWKTKSNENEQVHSIAASDTNTKIFTIKNKFGLGTFGQADIKGIPISGFISAFTEEKITEDTTIDEIPELLMDYFGKKHNYPKTFFYALGYKVENGISVPHVYVINIGGKTINRVNFIQDKLKNGANWGGEVEVLSRILTPIKVKDAKGWREMGNTPIVWDFMTMQDAIDFAIYAIRTTIETMRFQRKEKTVGGPIDLLIIKPGQPPQWIQRKKLGVSDD